MPYVSKNRRKKKRGLSVSRKVQNIWLAVLAVLVLGAVVWAVVPKPAAMIADTPNPAASKFAEAQNMDHDFVLALGDSYTGGSNEGGSRGTDSNWVGAMSNTLRGEGLKIRESERGVGGSGYVSRGPEGPTIGEQGAEYATKRTDVIVFFGSINDRGHPMDDVRAAADEAWKTARKQSPDATIIIIGPAWMNPDVPAEILALRDALASLAEDHGLKFIDPIEERWFLDAPELIGDDGVHPTDEGHLFMAEQIAPHVEAALTK